VPTYEYACSTCGNHVEVVQRFSDEPLSVCGVCGGSLRKVFHPAGILFKGSGFYATDSRRSAKKSTSTESGSTSSTDSSDGGSSESKKAEKPAPPASTSTKEKSA
jgi:putative FmdB family regulatory protein